MEVWVVIVSILLLVGILVLGALNVLKIRENTDLSGQQMILPFRAKIDPSTGSIESGAFQTSNGDPQISCPVGSHVNIVGAFYDIFDPYSECSVNSSTVNPLLSMTCDPSSHSMSPCSSNSDCPYYNQGQDPSTLPFTCNGGFCSLQNVGDGASCPQGLTLAALGSGYYCIDPNVCGTNIDLNVGESNPVPNPYCTPSNTGSTCAMRDASAKVAKKCNGRQSCPDLNDQDFGMTPCNMAPTTCFTSFNPDGTPNWASGGGSDERTGYCGLPYVPGFPGGLPYASSTNNTVPGNGNLGYTMHGLYTCVPDS